MQYEDLVELILESKGSAWGRRRPKTAAKTKIWKGLKGGGDCKFFTLDELGREMGTESG